ncbi:MAG: hypothetical protein LBC41_17400, partial [Clostridiales bacterium]|nr:hypothetical protein [Clostridiales bacterium]
ASASTFGKPFANSCVDTMRISRALYPAEHAHSLKEVATRLGVAEVVDHRALPDAMMTMQCYELLKQKAMATSASLSMNKKLKVSDLTPSVTAKPIAEACGLRFAFSGNLSAIRRMEALQAVLDSGGICEDGVSAQTDWLVIPDLNAPKSKKRLKAERFNQNGSNIRLMDEGEFLRLFNVCP